jgi:tetratricopeptide (TPR) repeat protein
MAKISLRVYNREIEGLIEGGQLDEAVAHCQHILKTFSMHIETYQLLGKAFLEAHRYSDAADIFQRILNAAPDDFIAQVGMSIIRDDEGKLDEAIWHMERAFEVQPSNPAIQGELRRLFGRRDGVEPPKIRLSRDALANMYAQGELFNQAIAEIRAVLADDPDRPDLQVMLARAYLRIGQKVEAAEIAAHLLKKYPYCRDALRVLVEVLPGTARSENTQVYRQRLRVLDPYSSFVTGSVFASDQVADASVNLERLEYLAGKQNIAPQPTWAASLGIKLDEAKQETSRPGWLKENHTEIPAEVSPPIQSSEPVQEGEALPDFLRAAGWSESDGQPSESEPGPGGELPATDIAKGEMPDWLKSQVPPEFSGAKKPGDERIPDEGGDFPDWLTDISAPPASKSTVSGAGAESSERELPAGQDSFAPIPIIEQSANPDPLKIPPSQAEPSLASPPEIREAKKAGSEDDATAWLEDLTAKQEAKPEELIATPGDQSEEIPDWLKSTTEEQHPGSPQPPVPESQPIEVNDTPITEQPDREQPETISPAGLPTTFDTTEGTLSEETESHSATEGGTAKPLGIEDDTMAWLEGLAAKQGAKPEELLTKPEERSEELPDWLKKTAEEPPLAASMPPTPDSEQIEANEPPMLEKSEGKIETMPLPELRDEFHIPKGSKAEDMHPQTTPEGSSLKPPDSTDDNMAWLEELPTTETGKTEEPVANSERDFGNMPDWLQETAQESGLTPANQTEAKGEKPAIPEETATEEAILSPKIKQASAESPQLGVAGENPPGSSEEDITITTWLKNLDESSSPNKIPALPPVSEAVSSPQEEIPDWLKDLEKTPAHTGSITEKDITGSKMDIPEWLNQPTEPPPDQSAPQMAEGETKLPEWALEDAESVIQPAPTVPAEWLPVDKHDTVPASIEEKPPVLNESAIPVSPPARPLVPKGTGSLSSIPSQDKDAIILSAAQELLDGHHLVEAMKEYSKLIKKGRLLDEVIHDLREALYRFPVDIILWQSLGDAYMRANRLQDALDAYTKAEELLR